VPPDNLLRRQPHFKLLQPAFIFNQLLFGRLLVKLLGEREWHSKVSA
jgi:hypothetical protein